MNNKGFTLIEVLAVVAIIAIVGTIAVPGVLSMIGTSKDRSYDIMIDNIRTAAEEMYQEIDYFGTKNNVGNFKSVINIKKYNICEEIDNNCKDNESVRIEPNGIMTINLQTLIGNGFLTGANNNNINNTEVINKNKKILINPKDNEDIGFCEINVIKSNIKNSNKVCYKIETVGMQDEKCPSDYKNEVGCGDV